MWDWETQGQRGVELLLVKEVRGQLFLNRLRNPQSITQTRTQTETHAGIQMHANTRVGAVYYEMMHFCLERRCCTPRETDKILWGQWINNQSRTNGKHAVYKQSVTTQTTPFSNPAFALNDVSLGPSITLSSPALPTAAARQRWMFESAKSLKALL